MGRINEHRHLFQRVLQFRGHTPPFLILDRCRINQPKKKQSETEGVGISGTRYVDIAHVLSEVELIDLSNLMSDYSFLICTQSVPNIDSQSLY
jgi:hypothetical protein